MRFSLQDVRKSVQRRGGELSVSLHFLRPGELHTEIARLIDYHESLLGQPQRTFSPDDARACIGDYRMANCLIATLSNWYSWQTREWSTVAPALTPSAELVAFTSPTQLRLALYNYVNMHFHGFLSVQHRGEALQAFAAQFQLSPADLEYLLLLDDEEEAILVRAAQQPPEAQAVATLYNQWVFESALFNASSVRFVIDCAAFAATQLAGAPDQAAPPVTTTGIGSVIKRLCYLARRLGVYYDLEYAPPDLDPTPSNGAGASPLLALTLYGPQDVTGAPQQYGVRLARLCRVLLGFAGSKTPLASAPRPRRKAHLTTSIVRAEARIHFLQRAYSFVMPASLPEILPIAMPQETIAGCQGGEQSELFDSSIEQSFAEAFISLASSQGADGWQLEREPEPLLLEKGIFIPDFALTRGQRRVYMEILGFWTPSYRERKVQKLQQLQDRDDLLLALPVEACAAFADIIPNFPVVVYQDQLSATSVLQELRKHYDDFAQRLASVDIALVREKVRREGFVAEQFCYPLLRCFRRSELQQAAERVVMDNADNKTEIAFVAGIGLFHHDWLAKLKQDFLRWLTAAQTTTLREAIAFIKARYSILDACPDTTIESLLSLWYEIVLQRDSIFDASITLRQQQEDSTENSTKEDQQTPVEAASTKEAQKSSRERRPAPKKRAPAQPEAIQGDLWG
ncbi:MAG: hypothetical protein NVS2B12_27620 [Ktedonobacteraceae bacterium]